MKEKERETICIKIEAIQPKILFGVVQEYFHVRAVIGRASEKAVTNMGRFYTDWVWPSEIGALYTRDLDLEAQGHPGCGGLYGGELRYRDMSSVSGGDVLRMAATIRHIDTRMRKLSLEHKPQCFADQIMILAWAVKATHVIVPWGSLSPSPFFGCHDYAVRAVEPPRTSVLHSLDQPTARALIGTCVGYAISRWGTK